MCNWIECDEEPISESARTFGEKYKQHLKATSPIYDHSNITGHHTSIDNFSIVGGEAEGLTKAIKDITF